MISIISGAVNQGKSTQLLRVYRSLQKGDGFYNLKIYKGDCLAGQKIVHLATGESRLYSCRDGFMPENWHEECRFEAFGFSGEGLDFGRAILRNAAKRQIEPLFIDEIGPLEFGGKGFDKIFAELAATELEMYVVIRKSCLDSIITKYALKKYRVIDVDVNY